jgi:hypothetical protein
MRLVGASVLSALLLIVCTHAKASHAQEISGFSTVSVGRYSTGGNNDVPAVQNRAAPGAQPAVITNSKLEVASYIDTQEDYTASLYYDVSSASSVFQGGSQTASGSFAITGNPSATATYLAPWNGNALYTEATNHIVDFFYVTADGEYSDPYGFSTTGDDGDYDSGYWFSVYSDLYVAVASIVLGQSYDSTNSQVGTYIGQETVTVLYQTFIPPAWVPGPAAPLQTNCYPDIYLGDNRSWNPALASYRAFQQISVGVGGETDVNPFNAPPAQDTGWTYEFSQNVLVNNQIPDAAYNYDYIGDCSASGINLYGHASTENMVSPGVVYNGTESTSTTFSGSAADPVPIAAFPVDWDATVTLTEPNVAPAVLHASGSLSGTCYPAHEVSVGTTDVAEYPPYSNSTLYIAACLTAGRVSLQTINQDIPLSLIPH